MKKRFIFPPLKSILQESTSIIKFLKRDFGWVSSDSHLKQSTILLGNIYSLQTSIDTRKCHFVTPWFSISWSNFEELFLEEKSFKFKATFVQKVKIAARRDCLFTIISISKFFDTCRLFQASGENFICDVSKNKILCLEMTLSNIVMKTSKNCLQGHIFSFKM